MPSYSVSGRTVVLTGATGGLGTALARSLRDRGARLALLGHSGDAATTLARELGDADSARGWQADVRDLDGLTRAIGAAAAHFGRIDIAIANAGVGTMAPLASLDPAQFERVIDVNLNGVWRTFRAALPHVQRQRGYLLAVSSLGAFVHSPLHSPYTASKAGVWAMCDSLRLEVRGLGVGVGTVHPTFFGTQMMADVLADPAGRQVWGGNRRGSLFRMVTVDSVVRAIVRGIERRANIVVVPRVYAPIARVPGLFGPILDRIVFKDSSIARAIELSDPAGWNDHAVLSRRQSALGDGSGPSQYGPGDGWTQLDKIDNTARPGSGE